MTQSTAHYTVLARRYRPQTFDDVIGQQNVAQALRNAIHGDRVAHAYLFTGARGVGKTSMARILAKALNCPHAVNAVPCNECEICTGISRGNDVDVMEIDGASNNGVEDIRSLRANVNVKSMRTQFKLYIIDEVHMLSNSAFNALLKTLEEPPPSVKFVFCTTEPNKLPDTILSRCQRFDFTTIETSNIVERLHQIAIAEGYTVEADALELVARRAAGSMRDSQSLFDQLLAFGDETITSSDVHKLLGTASDDRLIALASSLINRDRAGAMDLFDRALAEGVQLGEFVGQLVEYCRDLMVIAAGTQTVALLSVAASSRDALSQQAKAWGLETIVAAMEILAEARARMSRVTFGRAIAELALIRVSLLQDMTRIDELVRALNAGAVQPLAAQKKSLVHDQRVATSTSVPVGMPTAADHPAAKSPAPEIRPSEPHVAPIQTRDTDKSVLQESPTDVVSPVSRSAEPKQERPFAESASTPNRPDTRRANGETGAQSTLDPAEAAIRGNTSPSPVANSVPDEPLKTPQTVHSTVPRPVVDTENVVLKPAIHVNLDVGQESKFLAQLVDSLEDVTQSHVRGATNIAISGPNGLELSFPKGYNFSKTYCERPEIKLQLEQIASRIAGKDVRISLKSVADAVETKSQPAPQVTSQRIKDPGNDEFVQQAMSVFGATIVKVEGISGPVPSEDMNP